MTRSSFESIFFFVFSSTYAWERPSKEYIVSVALTFTPSDPIFVTSYCTMIYEYKCHSCETISEFWMKLSDPAPTECPHCKGSSLEKLISKSAFALKGSGWYTTDYKKASSGTSSSSSSSEASNSTTSCCHGGSCTHKG